MAASPDIDSRLQQINQRLKAAQMGVQLERRGQKLSLRGTFPPRPESSRLQPYQQRLSLGLPATKSGLKQAEQEAKIVAARLLERSFDWRNYQQPGGKRLHQMSLSEQIEAFRSSFFQQRHTASAQTTWRTAYAPYLRKLEAIAQSSTRLTPAEAIYTTLDAIPPNTRSRQVACTALNAFAQFLDLELPQLDGRWGSYSRSQTKLRQLPTDEIILEAYHRIPNSAWQFVYGMMATYGLRNHEVFFCDYSRLLQAQELSQASVEVLETTKTGQREVWPFHPEWVTQFNLQEVILPNLTIDLAQTTLQRIGQKVTTQLRRYQLPFKPYDLRHAWAIRTIHVGLPDTVAAQMMGHSVSIHTQTYHRWITRRDHQQAVDAALGRR
ncbi:MAG: site-specific integrase [Elainellaceae cyanobacterium]